MALTGKKYEALYVTTGSGDDKVTTENLTKAEAVWDHYRAKGMDDYFNDLDFAPIIFQLQQMQDEIDYLRTEISTNKDKTVLALGTSGTTALAGDTNIVTIGSSTTIAFGDMVTIPPKGKTPASYSVVMTVVNGGVTKTVKLTLT